MCSHSFVNISEQRIRDARNNLVVHFMFTNTVLDDQFPDILHDSFADLILILVGVSSMSLRRNECTNAGQRNSSDEVGFFHVSFLRRHQKR